MWQWDKVVNGCYSRTLTLTALAKMAKLEQVQCTCSRPKLPPITILTAFPRSIFNLCNMKHTGGLFPFYTLQNSFAFHHPSTAIILGSSYLPFFAILESKGLPQLHALYQNKSNVFSVGCANDHVLQSLLSTFPSTEYTFSLLCPQPAMK